MKKLLILLAILAALYVAAVIIVPPRVDRAMTRVNGLWPFDQARPSARALHERLVIADLHADSLIWGRDLLRRDPSRGQVDIPRLHEANVALQVFSVPTKVPKDRPDPHSLNLLTMSAIAQAWPPATWFRLDSRALHAAKLLDRFASRSGGALTVIRTRGDLQRLLEARGRGAKTAGGVLAIEGLHSLEGDAANVDRFFDRGYRMAGLVHQFDNDLGGSSQGAGRGGLTPFGRTVVQRMEERGMIIDLAHASPAVIRDVLAMAKKPVVVSHTGVRGTCDRSRNLTDDEVRAIAAKGGLIGIGFWSGATCGSSAKDVARAMRHAANLAGADHVSLGSDFDGDRMPFDATGLVQITDALLGEGFSEGEIRKIMGDNVVRFLMNGLPE